MKPATRTIVLGHATVNKVTHTWPVAIFGQDKDARHHANYATMASRTGDADLLKKFDPNAKLADDGMPIKTAWYTFAAVPFEPEADFGQETPAS